jgi:hypothetical protein
MEQGAVAVVKLPFACAAARVNWYSADELATEQAATV